MNITEIEESDLRAKFGEILKKYGMLLTVRIGDHDGFIVDLFSPYYGIVERVVTVAHGEREYYTEVEALINSMPVIEVERLRKQVKSLQDAINAMNAQFEILQTMYDKEVAANGQQ